MPLSEKQKELLKSMPKEDREELMTALGIKPDADYIKTLETLQSEVAELKKTASRRPGEDRRKKGGSSWFSDFFGVSE